MLKFIKKLFKKKEKHKTSGLLNDRSWRAERMFPPFRIKQKRPPFPSTFVFEDYVYEQWNQDLIDKHGWTKKEIKQGWRWVEL
jgi:hypothetical protein